jgi:hypothetical protein
MAMSTGVKIGIGVAVVGIAFYLFKSKSTPTPVTPAVGSSGATPAAGVPTNATVLANAAPGLIAALQTAISGPVQSPTTSSHP